MSIKSKTAGGLFWTGLDAVGATGIRLLVTIILSRLLEPEDFGLIAMFAVFISLSETLVQSGFGVSLIRKKDAGKKDFDTVFTFNLILSLALYILIFSFSGKIASFYDQPLLKDIARVSGLVIVFNALGFIQNVHFRKSINFKPLAIISIISSLLSGSTGVYLAYNGFGVWSLVYQHLLKALFNTLLLWFLSNQKAKIGFNKKAFKENFNFGYKITLANLVNTLSGQAYNIVIGKFYSAGALGYFYQARRLSNMIHKIITNVFNRVSYPVLSSVQDKMEKFRKTYIQFLRAVSFISFPLMMLFIVISPNLIPAVLSDKWTESVPYFQLLCFSGMLIPMIVISGNVPLVKGRSDISLKLELVYKSMMIIALIATAWISVHAMVIGIVIQIGIQFFINMYYVYRFIAIKINKQLHSITDLFLIAVLVSFLTYLFHYLIEDIIFLLVIQILFFSTLYYGINVLFKNKEIKLFWNLLIKKNKELNQ